MFLQTFFKIANIFQAMFLQPFSSHVLANLFQALFRLPDFWAFEVTVNDRKINCIKIKLLWKELSGIIDE
jgi:hypothetical protein